MKRDRWSLQSCQLGEEFREVQGVMRTLEESCVLGVKACVLWGASWAFPPLSGGLKVC